MNMEINKSKFQQKKEKVKNFFKGVFSRKKKEEAPLVLAQEKKELPVAKKEIVLSKELEQTFPIVSSFLKKYGISEEEYQKSAGSIRAALKSAGKLYDQGSRSLSRLSVVDGAIVSAIREKYGISDEEYRYIKEDHPHYVWAMFPAAVDFAEYLEGFGRATTEEREHYVQGKREAAKIASYRATVIDALKKYELSPLYDDAIMPVCANHALSNEEISEAIGFYKVFAALALPKQLSIAEHIEEYSNSVLGKKSIEVEHVQNKKNE